MRGVIATLVVLVGCGGSDVSRDLGARCDTSADCSDVCLPPGAEYPGGFCTRACTTETQCPENSHCTDKQGGVCLVACILPEDCTFLGAGWTCKDTDGTDGVKRMVCRGD